MNHPTARGTVVNLFHHVADMNSTPATPLEHERREQLSELGVTGKAFMILEIISRSAGPITISEVIRITGLTKPTTHRIVNMLVAMEFLERDVTGQGLIEGRRLVALAHQTLVSSAPRSLRHNILQEIVAESGETCNYGTLYGLEVIYLDRVETQWPLGLRFAAGSRVPAHCTAIGKLMLSFRPDNELKRIFNANRLAAYTNSTITDPDRLLDATRKVRKDKIGTDNQEFMHGVVCVAVPVIDGRKNCFGAIALSAPEARMTLHEMLGFVPRMRDAAQRFAETFSNPIALVPAEE